MYSSNYKIYKKYYVKPSNFSDTDKSRFDRAISELDKFSGGDYSIVNGYECRISLFKFLSKLNDDESFIAFTDKQNNVFSTSKSNLGELLFPFNFFFRGDTEKIIRIFNKNGFKIFWSGNEEDAMLCATDKVIEKLIVRSNNYDFRTRCYDLY